MWLKLAQRSALGQPGQLLGALPNDFDWSFLAGHEISLINTESFAEYEKLKELAVLLVQSGAKRVGLIDQDHPLEWFIPENMKAEAA